MYIKRIIKKEFPLIFLEFENGKKRILDVRNLESDYFVEYFEKIKVDEFGGLEVDLLHSACPDGIYDISEPYIEN